MRIYSKIKAEVYNISGTPDCHIQIKIPTTIFDPQKAFIDAYRDNRIIIRYGLFLKKMPKWDRRSQLIRLTKTDERGIEKLKNKMLKKLDWHIK